MKGRKLLELAAKAAGLDGWWSGDDYCFGYNGNTNVPIPWRPITDDGDALRLAVKLGIELRGPSKSRSSGRVVCAWYPPDGNPDRSACAHVTAHVNGDRYAATRRAIVCAAAQIGKAMP